MPTGLFVVLFAYLVGSVPTGLILARFFSPVDPRQAGSGNIGATNVFRTAGKILGILTLVGDAFKGVLPMVAAIHLGLTASWVAGAGLAAFLGHLFPVFLGFKGGKGVATALGVYLVVSPLAVLIEALLFVGVVWKWRYISLGSILCAATIPLPIAFFRSDSRAYFVLSLVVAALIVYRHRSNITRLFQGTENRWKG
jgi:glycerol-3-phosphate acyltransferase PlsY